MSRPFVTTKAVLQRHIDRDWTALQNLLQSLSLFQLTEIKNADGWTIKDHVAHMTAWERSVHAFLTGTPRHIGLGVSEEIYLSEDIDAINLAVFELHRETVLDTVLENFRATHGEVLSL